jgi:hypothetical protein
VNTKTTAGTAAAAQAASSRAEAAAAAAAPTSALATAKHPIAAGEYLKCDVCRVHIQGPLLKCIHCPCAVVCVQCQRGAVSLLHKDHVFQVVQPQLQQQLQQQQQQQQQYDSDDDGEFVAALAASADVAAAAAAAAAAAPAGQFEFDARLAAVLQEDAPPGYDGAYAAHYPAAAAPAVVARRGTHGHRAKHR